MEPELTPEQKEQMKVWAGQRDALNIEIYKLRQARESLVTANNTLADSSSDLEKKIVSLNTRLEELDKKEKDYYVIVSSELSEALVEKTRLEEEVTRLNKTIELLTPQKEHLEKDISMLTTVFNTMNDRASMLEKVVDHVVKVSHHNEDEISRIVANLKTTLSEVVDVNQKNVTATNQVLTELPRMLVELQKHGLIKNKR